MKAVRIHSYGPSDQLKVEDAPQPKISENQLLVKIHDAGVNPIDWKIREGYIKGLKSSSLPLTIGQDFSGEVVEVGDQVSGYKVGDDVFGFAHGTYAEFAAVSPDQIAHMPSSVDYATAAAIPTAGLTAWQLMTQVAQISKGQTILIQGAAGGVGSFAVQLAKWKGARIYGTAAQDDAEYLNKLGIERVIDYKTERFEEVVKDVDVVVDLVGGKVLDLSYQVVKKGGLVVTTVGPLNEEKANRYGIRGVQFRMKRDPNGLEQLARLVDQGIIKPRMSEVLPFSEVRRAHDLSQKGLAHGKIVLEVM